MPKLKGLRFETAIIERYKRRETSIEEALIEMYLAGVSVRRVKDITQALWGTKVSPGTISNLNQKAYVHIEEWRQRKLTEEYPYVYVDGVYLKRSWGGEVKNVSVLIAIGIDRDGYRQIRHRRNVDVYGFSNGALEPAPHEQRDGTRQPQKLVNLILLVAEMNLRKTIDTVVHMSQRQFIMWRNSEEKPLMPAGWA